MKRLYTYLLFFTLLFFGSKGNLLALNSVSPTDTTYVGMIYLPNAFTPQEDFNNVFLIQADFENIILEDFKIYNRWGEMLFETKDIKVGWNGTYKGKPCNSDTYVYKVRYRIKNQGKTILQKVGTVSIIQ